MYVQSGLYKVIGVCTDEFVQEVYVKELYRVCMEVSPK